mmetsp:Transcript_128683/g.320996  ORF Transcript_128683/g.320996 Transcript_128683/m.320996 type:complete len:1073 (-) Transcript_128683:13-3231(-)
MGCLGSKDSYKDRLDKVEDSVGAVAGQRGGDGLSTLASCAADLKDVMDIIITNGANDSTGIRRIEKLSESILGNLESRVSEDFLKLDDADTLTEQMLGIARDLDAVRATKASAVIEDALAKLKSRIGAREEAKAMAIVGQVRQTLDQIKEPAQVMAGAKRVLDGVAKAHEEAPKNTKVVDLLLKATVELATKIMGFEAAWVPYPERAASVRELAARLDTAAEGLVVVVGAKWDPPMAPQIDRMVKAHALKLFKEAISGAEKAFANKKCGAAFDHLEVLKPLWPELKSEESVCLQLVGIISKIQTLAVQDFINATMAGDTSSSEGIRAFAVKFDALREGFEGLPPSAGGPLIECLVQGEATVAVEKQLKLLEAEAAKSASEGDIAAELGLATIVQALEALVPVWPQLPSSDETFPGRLQAACNAVESWVEGAVTGCSEKKVSGLLSFSEEYDDRRSRLAPPEPEGGPLRPRVAVHATEAYLAGVEAELAKPKGLNPNALLDGLKAGVASVSGAPEEAATALRERLGQAVAATTERVRKTFQEIISAGEARKAEMIMAFARTFDEARTGFEGLGEAASGPVLVEELQGLQDSALEGLLQELEDAVAIPDVLLVLSRVKALQPWWPRIAEAAALQERSKAALASLPECLDQAVAAAGDSGGGSSEGEAQKALLEAASALDTSLAGLPLDGIELPQLRGRVLGPAARAHLDSLDVALRAATATPATASDAMPAPLDFDVWAAKKRLEAVGELSSEGGAAPPGVWEPLHATLRALAGGPLAALLMALLVDGDGRTSEASELAVTADAACAKLAAAAEEEDPEPAGGGLRQRVERVKGAAAELVQARQELAKPSGCDPRRVLQALKALPSVWPVGGDGGSSDEDSQPLRTIAVDVCRRLAAKFAEAGQKAIDSNGDVAKKLAAVGVLAQSAQDAHGALSEVAPGLEAVDFQGPLAAVSASRGLAAAEAELAKESGMNPAKILQGIKDATPFWAAACTADASLPTRFADLYDQVQTRMAESMLDAVTTHNEKKKQGLLKFASEFDKTCAAANLCDSKGLAVALQGRLESQLTLGASDSE